MTRAAYAELLGKKLQVADEDALQIAVVHNLEWRARPGVIWFMIRNHGKRGRASHGKDKAMGLRKGASDLGFIIPPNGQAAMLELKHGKNKPSKEQDKFGVDVEAAGAFFAIAWDLDTALSILEAWRVLKPSR